jgi:hypothetical protein
MKINQKENPEVLADACHHQMAVQSILISETKDKEKQDQHERDFNNYKHYDI